MVSIEVGQFHVDIYNVPGELDIEAITRIMNKIQHTREASSNILRSVFITIHRKNHNQRKWNL